jgi:hypothetical protein
MSHLPLRWRAEEGFIERERKRERERERERENKD